MTDISSIINQTVLSDSISKEKNPVQSAEQAQSTKDENKPIKEINYTDPKVCHDPSLAIEGIAKLYTSQNKFLMENGEISAVNENDSLKTNGILYPLVVINDRDISNIDILNMVIKYDDFLPTIRITIHDIHEFEQKINSSQMSGLIRVCMISPVDKVYKKILLNFRITDSRVDPNKTEIVTYFGEYNVPGFKPINTKHIWMENVCPKQITCQQGGHINANTWEMLHQIAEESGLGFAATKQCKEINDRSIRNIYSQRYDQYIKQQLLHSGCDEQNIFDAWVDLYGYIVMVNVPWVLNQEISARELSIVANTGIHGTTNDLPEQKPDTVDRTLTNWNLMVAITNLEIESYNIRIDNNVVNFGTLEHIYMNKFRKNKTELCELDIQIKQNSVDGEYLEDYNTGKNRPMPRFDFNDDAYTGLSGGYDLHNQKIIRNAFFRKHRQSILEVILKNVNFGLQRGTLVNIAIFDNDPFNKSITFKSTSNLGGNKEIDADKIGLPKEINEEDIILDEGAYMPNLKLTGLYYIDGMKFEYSIEAGQIIQTLFLFKKGPTSGYENKHTPPRLPLEEYTPKPTLPADKPFLEEY